MTVTHPSANFTEIPVVDLAQWRGAGDARRVLADSVSEICHTVGFFSVVNHGVEPAFVDSVFDLTRRLFALPLEQKLLIDKRQSRHFRGWEPEGAEFTNNRPDVREQVDLWTEHNARSAHAEPAYLRLLGPNQWLHDDVLPGFESTLNAWFNQIGALASELMRVLATGLGLPATYFDTMFGSEPMSLTKLIHYPPTPAGGFGVNAHHDTGFLTVLAPGETAGLQVRNGAGEWIPVPCIANAFVINLGEMLQAISGNYFLATPHRVATREERFSLAYFHGPSLQTPLLPLQLDTRFTDAVKASPRHMNAGYMAQRAETEAGVGDMQSRSRPDVYGEQLWNYFGRSYPDNMARHYPGVPRPS